MELCLRSSHPKVLLWKSVLKICSTFTGEYPCRSVILIKLQRNFIETTLRHGYSPVKLLHISRTPFPRNASGWLLLPLRSSQEVWQQLQAIMIDNGQHYCRIKKWIRLEKSKNLNPSLAALMMENTVVEKKLEYVYDWTEDSSHIIKTNVIKQDQY